MKTIYFIILSLIGLALTRPLSAQSLEPTDLDWATLITEFNLVQDEPTIVSLFGTNCPACIAHRNEIMNLIMNQCDNPDLNWFIIWFEDKYPSHATNRTQTEIRALEVDDTLGSNRVKQWWYTEHQPTFPKNDSVVYMYNNASWLFCSYPWDITFLYDSGVSWVGMIPLSPYYCMAKVPGCCNSYSISTFRSKIDLLDICNNNGPPIMPPIAGWSSTSVGTLATFTDESTGAFTWLWDFGDGNTSTMQNPQHDFVVDGTYNVCQTVNNSAGSDNSCKWISIVSVGVASTDLGTTLRIFPNPSPLNGTIQYQSAKPGTQFQLTDIFGKIVHEIVLENAQGTINLSGLANGIYVYTISENGQLTSRQKLVVYE